jgi:hypothetical protein
VYFCHWLLVYCSCKLSQICLLWMFIWLAMSPCKAGTIGLESPCSLYRGARLVLRHGFFHSFHGIVLFCIPPLAMQKIAVATTEKPTIHVEEQRSGSALDMQTLQKHPI